jgi:type I restriction enzyme R subunit
MSAIFGGEKDTVQDPLIGLAGIVGWEFLSRDEVLRRRGGETGLILREMFINQMQRLNPGFMDHLLADEVRKSLERLPGTVEGNQVAWEYLKGERTVYVPGEKREYTLKLLDQQNITRNVFQVSSEFSFTNGRHTVRADVVFFVNGFPVLLVETKSMRGGKIDEALAQLKRYHRDTPEFFSLFQVYSLTHLVRLYYSATWNLSPKGIFEWKKGGSLPIADFETLTKSFLQPETILPLLTDFILFTRTDDSLKKVVLRPHQMRAVGRIMERSADGEKKRGLIWHTQGSGKTYTMIVAAQKILETLSFQNPTVLMLVDRNELETQLFDNLRSTGIEGITVTRSIAHIEELLRTDKRGLIISMIHKFDGLPENLNIRDNIFILVDEAHRSTGGKLGTYLMGAIPHATYIGFTGTPIDRTQYGQGTFLVFGRDDPPQGYLDKYSIAESIEDGTTVELHYALAPNELRVDRETLEQEFLELPEVQGESDIESLNKVLERSVTLTNLLKNPVRVERIACYIAEHFREYVEPLGYKAFLVAADRQACAFYKEALDRCLPPDFSTVVYSSSFNDDELLRRYTLSEEEEKRVRKAFRSPESLPKILIVTEKLLTGFDAPVLYCMYLDKPMRDHVLLQAIARVNRPYEDIGGRTKPCGLVIDFVGLFEKLEKALNFDSSDISGVVTDLELLKDRFTQLMEQGKTEYLAPFSGQGSYEATRLILEVFKEEKEREDFYNFYRTLANIFEVLSPDPFLRAFLDNYIALSEIYALLREAYDPAIPFLTDLARKTETLVQKHSSSGDIKPALDVFEINENTLEKIRQSNASPIEQVFNLARSIERSIDRDREPFLIPIGERVEDIVRRFKDRQETTEQTLEELLKLVKEINSSRQLQVEKDFPQDVFTAYLYIKQANLPDPDGKAEVIKETFTYNPHWASNEKQEREVRRKLTAVILPNIEGTPQEAVQKAVKLTNNIIGTLKRGSS